jgi:carbamoyltransferase
MAVKPLVLGVNAFHGDSAAAVLEDGAFRCGVEEERLNRIKHWAGFPEMAIRAVLADAGAELSDVPHVAISRDPGAHLLDKVMFAFKRRPGLDAIRSRLANHRRVQNLEELLGRILAMPHPHAPSPASGEGESTSPLHLGERGGAASAGVREVGPGSEARRPYRGKIHNVEHHLAHIASAFFCSPFEEAACLTVDGFGDFLSSMSAIGRGNRIEPLDNVMFPHSLGIFYTAVTQFVGFPKYGDEYKVMGLASYGEPRFLPLMRKIVHLEEDGQFKVDLDYFLHASEGATMTWENGEPVIGPLWSPKFIEEFGPARETGSELTDRERDLAASLQAMYEEAFFHRANWLQNKTGARALCLAGGCAMNSVANGKIFGKTDFRDVFIQSAAGDAGTALGAALYVEHQLLNRPRGFVMEHSYWGPSYGDDEIRKALGVSREELEEQGCRIRRVDDEETLCRETAEAIAAGKIVGWYQGRSEWGPRALGNRSIVVDPRRAEMKDVLNSRIKRREPFRPFAPSILEERVGEYFEESYPDPFMIKVYPIRPEKRSVIPAVTHVDGTGRLQTVSKKQNPRYWALIKAFDDLTGVPVVLNTSFNENEPIVNTPAEALACFLRTKMDVLVLGNRFISREENPQ